MEERAPRTVRRGRPRDPQIEDRVFDAAIAVYSEAGWSGFSFDAIAKRGAIGKWTLYSRWTSRGDLLGQALEARWYVVSGIDTGALRGDLLELARTIFAALTGPHGDTMARLAVDAVQYLEVRASTRPYREAAIRQGRAIVRKAIDRGEIPPDTNPGLLMDLVVGAVTNHVATTPKRLRSAMVLQAETFLQSVVDAVLFGVSDADPKISDANKARSNGRIVP